MTCDLMTRAPRTGAHRPAQQTTLAPEPAGHPHRTPHHQSQVPAQVGPTPHRLPPGHPPVDHGTSSQTLPDAEPRLHRPGHWPAGKKADAGALRARRPRGAMVHVDIKKLGRIPAVAGGGCSAGALTRTRRPAGPVTRPGRKVRNPAGATGICITRSTVIPGWCTRRSSTTSIKTPRRVSGGGQAAFSRRWVCVSAR